jgi:hypothetical protein
MSHISKIRTQMVEKECLLKALEDLDYKYEVGKFTLSGMAGEKAQVEIKVAISFSNDIGFRLNNGVYEIVADWWGVRKKKEEFIQQLLQRYAYHAARLKLESQGFSLVSEEADEKGQIRLLLRRMG